MARGLITALRAALPALALGAALPAAAQEGPPAQTLQQRVEARLREAGPGIRFGLVVATEDGRELVAIAPDARFIPGSNTKMFTTAAAFATLAGLDPPDTAGGAAVRLETRGQGASRTWSSRAMATRASPAPPTASPTASPLSPTRWPRERAWSTTSSATTASTPTSAGARG